MYTALSQMVIEYALATTGCMWSQRDMLAPVSTSMLTEQPSNTRSTIMGGVPLLAVVACKLTLPIRSPSLSLSWSEVSGLCSLTLLTFPLLGARGLLPLQACWRWPFFPQFWQTQFWFWYTYIIYNSIVHCSFLSAINYLPLAILLMNIRNVSQARRDT